MAQSYKTIRRVTFPVLLFGSLSMFLSFLPFLAAAQEKPNIQTTKKPKKADNRKVQIFPHYQYRFLVPKDQADDVWDYLLKNYAKPLSNAKNAAPGIEEEQVTDLYFDTPQKDLLQKNLALRERHFISAEGRKERIQLLLPPPRDSIFGSEANFRQNKKPDKGESFTTHPLLKLLRNKDRPILDSLIKPYQIKANDLETALEINQDRQQIQILKNRNAWQLISLTRLQVQSPDHMRIQLQVQADPKALNNASPEVRLQLAKATDDLAHKFKSQFPEIKREKRTDYALMEQLRKSPAKQRVSTKAVFGATFLALILAALLYRKFRKKPVSGFE